MKSLILGLVLLFSGIRLVPHIMLMILGSSRSVIEMDLDRWGDNFVVEKARQLNSARGLVCPADDA